MRILFVSALLLALAACDASEPVEVEGTWALVRVESLDRQERPFRPSSITFTADGDYRSDSCNACDGEYRRRDGAVDIVRTSCTEAGCPAPDSADTLNDLSLLGVYDAAITGDTLRLSASVRTPPAFYTFRRVRAE